MIKNIVLFGATGDLSGRLLLPALAELESEGRLTGVRITASATEDGDDQWFRGVAAGRLEDFASKQPAEVRRRLVGRLSYRTADVTSSEGVAPLIDGEEPVACYLALPTAVIPAALKAIASAGLPGGSRIAVEKPFGEDLEDAERWARHLGELFERPGETVFNVDHALGMTPLTTLTDLRTRNPFPETVWDTEHVEEVTVLWEETMALEGRAGFYDNTGALKDVLQNHMMQVLTTAIIDPTGGDPHRKKVELLETMRADASLSRRGRYTAGTLADDADGRGRSVPDYVSEDGVAAERETETFAEVVLESSSPRWKDTRFRLRTGKALDRRRKGLEVTFRPAGGAERGAKFWLGVDGPFDATLDLTTGGDVLHLAGDQPERGRSPYANVLADFLTGGSQLAAGAEESVLAWRILTPVLGAWDRGEIPMQEYQAGSPGPVEG